MREPAVVTDLSDPRLAPFRLSDRELSSRAERRDDDASGQFLAEGDLVVERALDAGCVAVAALCGRDELPALAARLRRRGADVLAADDALRRQILRFGTVQPIVAVFERPARPPVSEVVAATDRLVVIEAVDNPANVGAIVRNAAALGWGGVVLDHSSADPLSRRALRVAMGTTFAVPHARVAKLADVLGALTVDGWATIALTVEPDADELGALGTFDRCAIVIGSERSGLSTPVGAACSHQARIPMRPGVDSLNAAAASAIACYSLA